MSDQILHECGLAVVRLLKPLDYYSRTYGDPLWPMRRLFLLMQKQYNRGQDGAGIGCVRFDMPPGERFIDRVRSAERNPIERLFETVMAPIEGFSDDELLAMTPMELKHAMPMMGEAMIGHLRYGTHGGNTADVCHPYLRKSIVASRNLAIAGNFNNTNSSILFRQLIEFGLDPVGESDTQVVLEKIGYYLDREHEYLASAMGEGSFLGLDNRPLADEISRQLDPARILTKATEDFDGGWVMGGLIGNGDIFVCRDPAGIRPAFIYQDDDVIAVASERPALAAAFNADPDKIVPLERAHALVIKADGLITNTQYTEQLEARHCTFERVYFSRGNDPDIYRERKQLGRNLAHRVLDNVGWDIQNTVFGFIPNTAETCFMGLREEVNVLYRARNCDELWERIQAGTATRDDVERLSHTRARTEKLAQKDQRLRTFITQDSARRDLVQHIYDITYGAAGPTDTLVAMDDSIVRGTTLRESIITMLARLNPKKILIVSSAPPIMYPDCYGIDMSQLGRFIAFEAAIAILHERGGESLLDEVESKCLAQADADPAKMVNHVGLIYDSFTLNELSGKISQLIRSPSLEYDGEIDVVYQTTEGLLAAMPGFTGDWYFTGDYPTPGGYRVLNRAFLNWRRSDDSRAY